MFNLSIEKSVFPNDLKIARVTPTYKGEGSNDVSNYRSISVLPCFSKILESIMYNLLYKYLIENNNLCFKQCCSTQLVDHIIESFENNRETLGAFTDP